MILLEGQFPLLSASLYTTLSSFLHYLRFYVCLRPICILNWTPTTLYCLNLLRKGWNITLNPRRIYHSFSAPSSCHWCRTGRCSSLQWFSGLQIRFVGFSGLQAFGFRRLHWRLFVQQFFSQWIQTVFDADRWTGTFYSRILQNKWNKISCQITLYDEKRLFSYLAIRVILLCIGIAQLLYKIGKKRNPLTSLVTKRRWRVRESLSPINAYKLFLDMAPSSSADNTTCIA